MIIFEEGKFLKKYGDGIRTDVFPGEDENSKIKILTAGSPVDSFYFIDEKGETILKLIIRGDQITSIKSHRTVSEISEFL